jgi:hypothetical protein
MKAALTVFCLFFLSFGCSPKVPGFDHFKVEFPSHAYQFDLAERSILFIQGSLPNKTYFCRLDLNTGKTKKINFDGYGLVPPFRILSDQQLAFSSALYVAKGAELRFTLFDLRQKKVVKSFPFGRKNTIVGIGLLPDSRQLYLLQQTSEPLQLQLKVFDPSTQTWGKDFLIGKYKFLHSITVKEKNELVMAFEGIEKDGVVFYDLKEKRVISEILIKDPIVKLIEANGKLYALALKEMEQQSFLYEIRDQKAYELAIFDGTADTFATAQDRLYLIIRDPKREKENQKPWLYPRNLVIFDPYQQKVIKVTEWTERYGDFLGYDAELQKINFAVMDADAPAIWRFPITDESLSQVKNVIK